MIFYWDWVNPSNQVHRQSQLCTTKWINPSIIKYFTYSAAENIHNGMEATMKGLGSISLFRIRSQFLNLLFPHKLSCTYLTYSCISFIIFYIYIYIYLYLYLSISTYISISILAFIFILIIYTCMQSNLKDIYPIVYLYK